MNQQPLMINMKKVKTRFAPSPTGYMHIGNARTAIINWLYAKKNQGDFILRFDDTDTVRSKEEYKKAIEKDLSWLGLTSDHKFNQSDRLTIYEKAKKILLDSKRLYPCFETSEELEIKRKLQLSNNKPPIYDRAALKLTQDQINHFLSHGLKPHYRFYINNAPILWDDMIKGRIEYHGKNLSDPIVIREDGSMTYMLCSVIDDIESNITHIIRGEDHVSNTALQIQMFEALSSPPPSLAHLSLIKAKDEKISKRIGGFDITALREQEELEPEALCSFLALIGSSNSLTAFKNLSELISIFDINSYSKSSTTYTPDELKIINHKLIISLDFAEVQGKLHDKGLDAINQEFWQAVRPNLYKLSEIKDWWEICNITPKIANLDHEFLRIAANLLPMEINSDNTWGVWTKEISAHTGKTGKNLFMPLRLALTGISHGPELKNILPLIGRNEIIKRLLSNIQ